MIQSSLKLAAIVMRWTLRGVSALLLLVVLAWAVLHWVIVPRIDDFRPRLEQLASRAIASPVSIGAITAHSNGLVPSVALRDVRVHDPTGRTGLHVPRVLAAFSVLSLGRGGFEQLVIDQPELELRRTADGRLLVAGIDLSGDSQGDTAAADWFFSQTEFLVRGGRVRWVDERRQAPPVQLSDVQFVARNGYGRHQLRVDATPEAAWGDRFTLIGQFRQPLFSRHPGYWRDWDGQLYAQLGRVDVSQLRQYADLKTDWGIDLRGGHGALRLWADLRKGALTAATADVALGAVSATFDQRLQPLAFASLTGRIGWRNPGSGMEVHTRDLQFVDADGLAWPGGNVRLGYRDGAGGLPAGGELVGDRLDLAALAKIAQRLPLPPALHQQLAEHPVQGLVERVDARWSGALEAPRDWRVQTRVSGLAVGARPAPPRADGEPAEGVPGLEGAALELQATPAGGHATLDIRHGALEFPGVFQEPRIPLDQLKLGARWRMLPGGHIELDVDQLTLANADATGSFKARWHTVAGQQGAARFPGVLDLSGAFSRANGARIHRYLPLGIPASARDYVRGAVQKGEARDVAVRIKGDLREVASPRAPAGSEFRFAGKVHDVTLAYVPRALQPAGQAAWPALEGLAGELVFDHNSMQVKHASARVQGHPGWQFTRVQAGIADLGKTRVLVDADGRGALASALGIVHGSPVSGFIQHALDRASASGDVGLRLKLDLPVARINDAKVDGRIQLAGNDVRITPDTPPLTQAHGAVTFSDTGFALHDARARLLGGEARLAGGTSVNGAAGKPSVWLSAVGTASAEALRDMADWAPLPALARQATGSAAYEAQIGFRAGQPDVLVTSDLRGMAFDFPAPLAKSADAAWPLRYESGQDAAGRTRFRVAVADQLAVEYEREAGSGRVLRGVIGVGAQAQPQLALPANGVAARLHLPRLDAEAWEAALTRVFGGVEGGGAAPAAGDHGFMPTAWSLRASELALDEHTAHDVIASGTREGATWRADVQARELAGRLEYSEGVDGRAGKLLARLSRLSIPAGASADDRSVLTQPPARIPALDVVVEDFELRGKKFGRLEVEATNRDVAALRQGAGALQEWELSRLILRTPEATFTANGKWDAQARGPALPLNPRAPRATGDLRRTALDFKLEVRDAGKLLTRLDMPDVLARGKGQLEGSLGWRGAPFSPHYPSMSGKLHLDVGAGQFLKADPGMAKLLGVLSLQALPRRLTLDFRDLFSAGFAFDFVRGDVEVARGIATTRNLQMKGPSAVVLMEGSADIDKEMQDLRVLVVPEIDAGTAALVATAINPVIGIGAFVAQLVLKRPLINAATREFHIGGSWDEPQVTRANARNGPGAAAPASAPAPAAEPLSQETS
ncbi:YhdP family protein [Ottowia testudinis]|uniref:YhdP family protein n=1 Tax=Ottowia testudinis TaxID=2816950 RepID=UPI001FB0EF4A|nr:YhdP family protein [Ottowia testudinis]